TLAANGSIFKYCSILYAGANDSAALAIRQNISATITSCVFAHHRTPTDALTGMPALDASEAAAGTVIDANVFYDNRVPLAVSTKFSPGVNAFDNALAAPLEPQPNKY